MQLRGALPPSPTSHCPPALNFLTSFPASGCSHFVGGSGEKQGWAGSQQLPPPCKVRHVSRARRSDQSFPRTFSEAATQGLRCYIHSCLPPHFSLPLIQFLLPLSCPLSPDTIIQPHCASVETVLSLEQSRTHYEQHLSNLHSISRPHPGKLRKGRKERLKKWGRTSTPACERALFTFQSVALRREGQQ